MWIFIPKIILAIPCVALALVLQHFFSGSQENLEWMEVRIIRETPKAFYTIMPRGLWLPKSVIRKTRMRKGRLEVLIPIQCIE